MGRVVRLSGVPDHDCAPYVAAGATVAIPLLDVANRYVQIGAGAGHWVLKGLSLDQIGADLLSSRRWVPRRLGHLRPSHA